MFVAQKAKEQKGELSGEEFTWNQKEGTQKDIPDGWFGGELEWFLICPLQEPRVINKKQQSKPQMEGCLK